LTPLEDASSTSVLERPLTYMLLARAESAFRCAESLERFCAICGPSDSILAPSACDFASSCEILDLQAFISLSRVTTSFTMVSVSPGLDGAAWATARPEAPPIVDIATTSETATSSAAKAKPARMTRNPPVSGGTVALLFFLKRVHNNKITLWVPLIIHTPAF
jgi:hypothetical protein